MWQDRNLDKHAANGRWDKPESQYECVESVYANVSDVLCLNELSGQTLYCHKQGSNITQNYATWNS